MTPVASTTLRAVTSPSTASRNLNPPATAWRRDPGGPPHAGVAGPRRTGASASALDDHINP